jgi:hypothetical protein
MKTLVICDNADRRRALIAAFDPKVHLTVGTDSTHVAAELTDAVDVALVDVPSTDLTPLRRIREAAPKLRILVLACDGVLNSSEPLCTQFAPAVMVRGDCADTDHIGRAMEAVPTVAVALD